MIILSTRWQPYSIDPLDKTTTNKNKTKNISVKLYIDDIWGFISLASLENTFNLINIFKNRQEELVLFTHQFISQVKRPYQAIVLFLSTLIPLCFSRFLTRFLEFFLCHCLCWLPFLLLGFFFLWCLPPILNCFLCYLIKPHMISTPSASLSSSQNPWSPGKFLNMWLKVYILTKNWDMEL